MAVAAAVLLANLGKLFHERAYCTRNKAQASGADDCRAVRASYMHTELPCSCRAAAIGCGLQHCSSVIYSLRQAVSHHHSQGAKLGDKLAVATLKLETR